MFMKLDHFPYYAEDIEGINRILFSVYDNEIPIISQVCYHIHQAGGKRLRPFLTLVSARLFQSIPPHTAYLLAAAVECIHTATLVHDDVIDQADERRHHPTAHILCGNKTSILIGDYLLSKAFELMVQCQDPSILSFMSRIFIKICQGEVLQMGYEHQVNTSQDDYWHVIDNKTGALFEAALVAGALSCQATSDQVTSLKNYAFYFGRAYQLKDDLLDYCGTETTGKKRGNDFFEGKMTLPIIYLFDQKPTWKERFQDKTEETFQALVSDLKILGVDRWCGDMIARTVHLGENMLLEHFDPESTSTLKTLISSLNVH